MANLMVFLSRKCVDHLTVLDHLTIADYAKLGCGQYVVAYQRSPIVQRAVVFAEKTSSLAIQVNNLLRLIK